MTISTLTDDIVFLPSLPENRRPKIEGDLSEDSLQVISPQTKFTGSLTVNENVGIGTSAFLEKLEVAGNIKITGGSIKNYEGLKIIETNKSDWLRINPDQSYPGIALYKPVAIGTGGLAIGEWSQLAQGQLKVTSSAYLATNGGNVGIGTAQPQPAMKLDVAGDIRAGRYCGMNILALNDFQMVNPSSNVYLYSTKNDRDSWLFLDSADTGSNWGMYHRQINSPVKGLPGNSVGFIGGGNSDLKAYIGLNDGNAYFKGNTGIGVVAPGEKLEVAGNIKIMGDSIKNFQGLRIIETNKSDWLRINPDQSYPGIALYKPVAIGTGGLAIGEWSQLAKGQLKVTSSAYLATSGGNVGIGTTTPNANVKLDVEGGAYLGYANTINNFNGILKSGFYQGVDPITGDVPDRSHGWSHLLTVRHSNTQNNHQLQIAGTFAMNDRLFFRKIAGGLETINSSWHEFATRGSNKFIGDQEVVGVLNARKIKSSNERKQVQLVNYYVTTSTAWEDLARITITTDNNPLLIIFQPASMQCLGGNSCRIHLRILLNDIQVAGATEEFNNNGWELRTAPILYLANPGKGTHRIRAQWRVDAAGQTARLNWQRSEGWDWQTTQLIALEL